jgi:Tfp pilus assembly protein PilF
LAAALVAASLLPLFACATAAPPVSKIVGGKVVLARPIHPDAYEHVARADLYEEQERYEEAIAELERALELDRDAPELWAHIAELELELERNDRAKKAAAKSLELGETTAGLLATAHVRKHARDMRGAIEALRRSAALTSFAEAGDLLTEVYLELADTQIESLDLPGARTTLEELAREAPASTVARLRLSNVTWSLGAMAEVERNLHATLTIEPNHIEAIVTLAWLATATGRPDEAEARFSDALERSENALDVATAFARFLMVAGKPAAAADLCDDLAPGSDDETLLDRMELCRAAHRYDRALALAQDRRARGELGPEMGARLDLACADMLADKKQPAAALGALERVPRGTPAYSAARLRAAELLREGGRLAEARRTLTELGAAGSAAPDAPDALTDAVRDEITTALAALDEKAGDGKAALARLAAAVVARPKSPRLRLAYASLLERAGRVPEALAQAEAIITEDPGSAEALNFWGFIAAEHGHDLGKATRRIEAALAFDPGSGAILDSLGWAQLRAGKLAEATLFLEQAARLEPEDPEILAHLAALAERKGERERALSIARKALGREPEAGLRSKLEAQLARLQAKPEAKTK